MGGAWLLTKENFLKDVTWLNMLKLKASYGIQGNDDLLDTSGYSNYYPYQDQYSVGRGSHHTRSMWVSSSVSGMTA